MKCGAKRWNVKQRAQNNQSDCGDVDTGLLILNIYARYQIDRFSWISRINVYAHVLFIYLFASFVLFFNFNSNYAIESAHI